MWWRLKRSVYNQQRGEGNRRAFQAIVQAGEVPGLLAYADGEPVGWVAAAPRERYSALERSRVLAPVDEVPVWSITCFFIAKPYRGRGVASRLLKAITEYAAEQGAQIIEGYPVDTRGQRQSAAFIFTGLPGMYRAAGFEEVARRSPTRPIMRFIVGDKRQASRRPARKCN